MNDNGNNTVETQTTTTGVETQTEVKTFTQEDVDTAVSNRINREKEALAKQLGLESYSKEGIESFVTEYNSRGTKITELEKQATTNENILFERDLQVEALSLGVKKEDLPRVAKLVKVDMQDNSELDMVAALTQVVEDFNFLGTTVNQQTTQVGVQTQTDSTAPNEVDAYMAKYKNSKYYKK